MAKKYETKILRRREPPMYLERIDGLVQEGWRVETIQYGTESGVVLSVLLRRREK